MLIREQMDFSGIFSDFSAKMANFFPRMLVISADVC